MFVTRMGLTPLASEVYLYTAGTAQTGARRQSPGVCDMTCAHLDLERRALQLQFPHPLKSWPALLIRMPVFLNGQIAREKQATRPMSEISCLSRPAACLHRGIAVGDSAA